LVTISHQLFHRLRFVDPVEFIRISLIIGYLISGGAAVLYVAQTLSAPQVDFMNFLVGLIGLAVAPILIVMPTVLALGDKPPPDDYD